MINYQSLWIDGQMPGLNDIIDANRDHYSKGANLKRRWDEVVGWALQKCKIRPVDQARFDFIWREKSKRRNPDNIAAAKKFIFDAMVKNKILPNDGWSQILGWNDEFEVSTKPGVLVKIYSEL